MPQPLSFAQALQALLHVQLIQERDKQYAKVICPAYGQTERIAQNTTQQTKAPVKLGTPLAHGNQHLVVGLTTLTLVAVNLKTLLMGALALGILALVLHKQAPLHVVELQAARQTPRVIAIH